MVHSSGVPTWFCRSNEFKVVGDNSHTSSRYSAPERRWRSGLRTTDEDLGTRLALELGKRHLTVALLLHYLQLSLVLLTSWVSYLGNYILTTSLTDTPTRVVDTPSGWASRWLRSDLTLFGLMDAQSKVMDTLIRTRRLQVCWVIESINQRTLRERSWTLRWGLCALGWRV